METDQILFIMKSENYLLTAHQRALQSTLIISRFLLLFLVCILMATRILGQTVVERYGRLQVANAHVCAEDGEQISLAGNSFFWSNWAGHYYNANTVNYLANEMGSSIVRAAMAVADDGHALDNGYLTNPGGAKAQVQTVVDAAVANGIYVIIDWHVEGDTRAWKSNAQTFFAEMAQQYGHLPNVIYEIWNEPTHTNWSEIRPYAVDVVNAIRQHDPDNLIIVGTETWSQRPDDASLNPIPDNNIAYTIHFYPDDANIGQFHRQTLRDNVLTAMNNGAAVFATEWGPSDGAPNPHSDVWMDFLKEHKISHCMWSVNDKIADGDWQWSIFTSGTPANGPYNLRGPGNYLKGLMDTWPWPSNDPIECTPSTLPGRVEAEDYCTQSGVQTESTTDPTGGNLNVGFIDNGDWMEYEVNIASAGTYDLDFRVAADGSATKTFSVMLNGSTLTHLSFQATGDWQNWTTVSTTAGLPAGEHVIRLAATSDGFNVNYMDFGFECNDPSLSGVAISPSNPSVLIGESIQLSATGSNVCGGEVAITPTWSANAPNGLFTATSAGTFQVSASAGGFSDQVTVTVAAENATLISNSEHNQLSLMNTEWFSYHDNADGGASTVAPFATDANPFTMTADGASGTANSARIDYTLDQGALSFDGYLGFGFDMKADETAYDLSGSTGISFWHKGSACSIMVPLSNNTDPDYYSASVAAHTTWTKVTINWSQLAQSSVWGEDVAWNAANILKFQWQVTGASGSGSVSIDEVKIEGLVFETPLTDEPCESTGLETLTLSPSNSTIGIDQTVNFTATGLDNCAQPVAITPVWSANAPNGEFTGTTEGSFTVTVSAGGLTASATVSVTDNPVVAPGLIQAENTSSVVGEIQLEDSGDADGTQNVGFFDGGDELHYAVNVPQGFNAKISLRVASDPGGNLILSTNQGELMTVQIPSTGGWSSWSTVQVSLDYPTSSEFVLSTSTGGVNVNWIDIQLNDCPTTGLSSLTISPANPKVLPNQPIQLAVSGLDGCDLQTAINAVWSANAPSGLFAGSAVEGTFPVTVSAGGLTQTVNVVVAQPRKKQDFVVSHHGRLQAAGNQIFGSHGGAVSLAGNSLFWSSAAPTWYSQETVDWLVSDWNTQIIRAAVSINPKNEDGSPWNDKDYVQSPVYTTDLVKSVVNAAIENDIYVIIDFHEHHADQYTDEAIAFFTEMAQLYNGYDNVIYELWNEPLNHGMWGAVKAHAEPVIAAIRQHDPDNLIVVGTPFFSQDVDDAANDPINDTNVAYALHGYATIGAHGNLRREYNAPIVGTEWGISVSDNGNGETGAWVDYWRNYRGAGLIHCMWAINNKQVEGDENWSILNSGVSAAGNWSNSDLSTSGHFQKSVIQGWTSLRPVTTCAGDLAAITVTPANASVKIGATVQLSASGEDDCGDAVSITPTWSANAPNGLFTATALGNATVTASFGGITGSTTVTVVANNTPVANAGSDIALGSSETSTTLNGNGTDADDDALTFSWAQVSGPSTATIDNASSASTGISGLVLGTYVFELTVSDGEDTDTDQVTVTLQSCTGDAVPGTIQAEDFDFMSGVIATATHIGFLDQGDWADYNINVAENGTYQLVVRVANGNNENGVLHFAIDGVGVGNNLTVAPTGSWNSWTELTLTDVSLTAGCHEFSMTVLAGPTDIDYYRIEDQTVDPGGDPFTIEAEDFDAMSGVQTESCSEGGLNVGWLDAGDWMAYDNVNIPSSGTYLVEYRVASMNGGGTISLEQNSGSTILGTVGVPATGGWQTWTTVSHQVTLSAGTQNFGFGIPAGGYNVNWIRFTPLGNARVAFNPNTPNNLVEEVVLYPNPTRGKVTITGMGNGYTALQVFGADGREQLSMELTGESKVSIDASAFQRGIYLIRLVGENGQVNNLKFLKE